MPTEIKVLDKGFIKLIDVMGDDNRIVQAARVSYGNDEQTDEETLLDKFFLEGAKKVFGERATEVNVSDGSMTVFMEEQGGYSEVLFEGPVGCDNAQKVIDYCHKQTVKQLDKDRALIRYLMNHSHTTPFEMVEFTFCVQVPMDCWRQWIRHRTANVNEYSTRYTEALDFFQVADGWRLQATDNKQGSSGFLEEWPRGYEVVEQIDYTYPDDPNPTRRYCLVKSDGMTFRKEDIIPPPEKGGTPGGYLSNEECKFQSMAKHLYEERLKFGVAKEQARKDLPLSTYTRAYWKCDLHNIFNFLRLRMDSHAQLEIRSYANAMFEIVKSVCPIACEAFEDYVLHAKRFSRMEMELIRNCIPNPQNLNKPTNLTDREWKDFLNKLEG